jgi:hypothetical protein
MLAAVVAWHPAEQLEGARRAIGLGQVREPMELMYADDTGQVELGPGTARASLPCR